MVLWDMEDSPEQQIQRPGPSGSGQLLPKPGEEEAGDDRSFALSGLFDFHGEDGRQHWRARPLLKKRKMPSRITIGGAKHSHRSNFLE